MRACSKKNDSAYRSGASRSLLYVTCGNENHHSVNESVGGASRELYGSSHS